MITSLSHRRVPFWPDPGINEVVFIARFATLEARHYSIPLL